MKIYFDDDEIIKRLEAAELKVPFYVIDYMENHIREPKERKDALVGIIELFEGKFLERVFAFKHDHRRKETLKYQEIIRQIEGNNKKLVRNYYMTSFCYKIVWPNTKPRSSYYSYYSYNNSYTEKWSWEYSCYTNSCYKFITTFNECIVLDPSIKYCGFEYTKISMHTFIEYVSTFRVFPEIEMYSKNNIRYLATDLRFYKKFKKSKEFSLYVRNNLKYIQENQPNYPKILKGFKSGESLQVYFKRAEFYSSSGYIGNENILTDKVVDIIIVKYEDLSMYLDYFNAAKHFIYMDTSKALYPDNLQESHDYYVEKFNEQRDKIKHEAFLQASKDWKWLNWGNKNFMIMVAPSITSLSREGQLLHHCVGRMNYDKEMAEGGNLIMFVRKIQ